MEINRNSSQQKKMRSITSQRGQILIEYILLLLIGITVANLLVKGLTRFSDEPDDRGIIIKRWINIWNSIGKDLPDEG